MIWLKGSSTLSKENKTFEKMGFRLYRTKKWVLNFTVTLTEKKKKINKCM